MFASTVRIDGLVKRQIRRVIVTDDCFCALDSDGGLQGGRSIIVNPPAVVTDLARRGEVTGIVVTARATTADVFLVWHGVSAIFALALELA